MDNDMNWRNCCMEDCTEPVTCHDDMENDFCQEHAEENRREEPSMWEDYFLGRG